MSTPLVEQKPFNAHKAIPWDVQECENDEVFGTSISFDLHYEDDDGFSFIAEFTNAEDAEFASHAVNTYYQREAELQSMRDRLSRMEEAGNAMRDFLDEIRAAKGQSGPAMKYTDDQQKAANLSRAWAALSNK